MYETITVSDFEGCEIESNSDYIEHEIDLGDVGYHNVTIDTDDHTDCYQTSSVDITLDTIASTVSSDSLLKEMLWELVGYCGMDSVLDALAEMEERGEAA